jgi:uncharacterized membrane protein
MAAGKLIVVAFGLLLVLSIGGFFGPGPLIFGLGPVLDQVVPFTLFLVLAFAAGPWLLRTFRTTEISTTKASPGMSSPEDILRERYARGELDRHQFLLMLEDLRTPDPRKT